MKRINIPLFVLLTLALLSCETEIKFNGPITDPALTVNSLVCADSTMRVDLTASRFFLDDQIDFLKVSDASVSLFINGNFQELLANAGEGVYHSTYVTKVSDVIKLSITAPGYPTVLSETTVPSAVTDFQIDTTLLKLDSSFIFQGTYTGTGYDGYEWDTIGVTYNRFLTYKVRFTNPANIREYFRLVIYRETVSGGQQYINEYKNDVEDIVFSNKKGGLDGLIEETGYDPYQIFTDEQIDGSTHTLTFTHFKTVQSYYDNRQLSNDYRRSEENLVIDVQSISHGYYLYLKSLKAQGASDPVMSEPVQIYTNVKNGLGILGARTHQLRKIDLTK